MAEVAALINWLKNAECLEYKGTPGSVYGGPAPFTFERGSPEANDRLLNRPWVIDHINMRGRLWRVHRIESFCLQTIRAGTPIALHIREEWKEENG